MKPIDYTAVVIGAGPAGSTSARVLARAGIDTLLVGAKTPGTQVGESLVPGARTILEELGVWGRFIAHRHLPCHGNLSAWGSSELSHTDFIRSPYGYGWHLDRASFDLMLIEAARDAGTAVRIPAAVIKIEREGTGWRVWLNNNQGISEATCKWILDCSGRSGAIVKGFAAERQYDDRLLAFYAHFRPDTPAEEDMDTRTLVESVPDGWFHTALLPSGNRIVTFFTDADTPGVRQAADRDGFMRLIGQTSHLAEKLKARRYVLASNPKATDARSSRLNRFSGDGWLAAGDAAIAVDPLSSQGILSALYSGLKAGKALVGWFQEDDSALEHYESLVSNVYNRFLVDRHEYYSYERRWPESPFWKNRLRHQGPS